MTTLSPAARAMLSEPITVTVATVNPDGSLHLTPTWIDIDGDDIIVNTLEGRRKTANLRRNPTVGICVIDPTNPFRVVSVSGTVVDITQHDADDHIDRLTQRYMNLETHPFRHPGDVRVKVRIRPDHVRIQPA